MVLQITDGHRHYLIASVHEPVGGETVRFQSRDEAGEFLRRCLHADPAGRPGLERMVSHALEARGPSYRNERPVVETAARLLVGRSLSLAHVASALVQVPWANRPSPQPGGRAAPPPPSSPARSPARPASGPAAVEEEPTYWFELLVLDEETGEPRPGVEVHLELPDGRPSLRTTGGDGLIRIEGLSAGTCTIREVRHPDGLEVVTLDGAP